MNDARVEQSGPLISVVVALFQGADTLQRCIDSVAGQTYAAKELIVVDGGSTDGTREILRRNESRISYWESEPDRGIYHAWNKGIARARGEWITFLGSDDYFWTADVLERMAPVLARAYPAVRIVYGAAVRVNRDGEEVVRVGEDWATAKRTFAQVMNVPHPGLMHHRSVFADHGGFDESFRIAGDYELLLRELRGRDALFVPDIVVAGVQHGGISATPRGRLLSLTESRLAQRRHGIGRPGRVWMIAYAKAVLRLGLWRILGSRIAPYVFDFGRALSGKGPYWTRQ
jgi:glycosyltransferase involved in cell wall biosynthesis